MVDPAIFRRIQANYPLNYVKNRDDEMSDDEDDEEEEACCCDSDSDNEDEKQMKYVYIKDKKGLYHLVQVPKGGDVSEITNPKIDSIDLEDGSAQSFTEEELLIASPVVLGFAFSDKLWLEFSISGIKEIEWNNEAFDSLVLPAHVKQNLKGLVSSHRFNAAKTIDDVIQGKGKGKNVVLHGPPGVGKTLTGESIADFLKCPLYAVSAGELGTNSKQLEADLNRIMEITHAWGAILLLDEADVFLEQRQAQDVHRNALVSVFLRLLEYYQGILFLTTNRVETFDEAFKSRIHMGIRYENLTVKARREIWKHYIKKVEKLDQQEYIAFKESDFDEVSKKVLNGREVRLKLVHV
jgi:SpoVK/Ycf46/Vps4 family AAA+-type ATPase